MNNFIKYLLAVICMMVATSGAAQYGDGILISKDGFDFELDKRSFNGVHTASITGISAEIIADAREKTVLEFPNTVEYNGIEYNIRALKQDLFLNHEVTGIKKVIVSSNCEGIYTNNFSDMPDLEEFVFHGPNLICSGNNFVNVPKLKSIYFPEWTHLGAGSFKNIGLEKIHFQYGSLVQFSEEDMFYEHFGNFWILPNLVEIDLADIRYVPADDFKYMPKLQELTFNAPFESIGENSFKDMPSLTKITFKKRDKAFSIDHGVFSDTPALTDIYVENTTPFNFSYWEFETNGFYPARFTLHVPVGSKALYEEAQVWKDFGEIVEYNVADGIDITDADSDTWRCTAVAGAVAVSGAQGVEVSILAIDGKLIQRFTATSDCVTVPLPAGLYIVTAQGRSDKVCVK